MESTNYKIIRNFINNDEVKLIVDWVSSINHEPTTPNHHLEHLSMSINGKSNIFDISKTDITKYITNFQSISIPSDEDMPMFIKNIINRISEKFELPTDNIFLQAVDMKKGGRIDAHYDASVDGFVNYKFNISVFSEDYNFYVGEDVIKISQTDLYCFEASLYKHWTNEFNSRRVFLSIGFMVPYSVVGRDENDPRVRLSKRIEKYFQKIYN